MKSGMRTYIFMPFNRDYFSLDPATLGFYLKDRPRYSHPPPLLLCDSFIFISCIYRLRDESLFLYHFGYVPVPIFCICRWLCQIIIVYFEFSSTPFLPKPSRVQVMLGPVQHRHRLLLRNAKHRSHQRYGQFPLMDRDKQLTYNHKSTGSPLKT
jgi:hypothetical protein